MTPAATNDQEKIENTYNHYNAYMYKVSANSMRCHKINVCIVFGH